MRGCAPTTHTCRRRRWREWEIDGGWRRREAKKGKQGPRDPFSSNNPLVIRPVSIDRPRSPSVDRCRSWWARRGAVGGQQQPPQRPLRASQTAHTHSHTHNPPRQQPVSQSPCFPALLCWLTPIDTPHNRNHDTQVFTRVPDAAAMVRALGVGWVDRRPSATA